LIKSKKECEDAAKDLIHYKYNINKGLQGIQEVVVDNVDTNLKYMYETYFIPLLIIYREKKVKKDNILDILFDDFREWKKNGAMGLINFYTPYLGWNEKDKKECEEETNKIALEILDEILKEAIPLSQTISGIN